jgi:helicase
MEHGVAELISMGLAEAEEGNIMLTPLGGVAVTHFLKPSTAVRLSKLVKQGRHPLDVVTELAPFEDVHSRLAERISKSLGYPVSSRIFSGGFLDVMSDGEVLTKLERDVRERLLDFATRFCRCECNDTPHCPCAQREFSREVLDLWMELGDVDGVLRRLEEDFDAYAYEGDLIDYLDEAIRLLEAVGEVAVQSGKKDSVVKVKEYMR